MYIEHSSYHSFQLNWVRQNIFAFVGHNNTGELVEMWIRVKNFWLHNLCKIKTLTLKTRLVFPTIDRNAEILSGGFNDCFSCCWVYWLLVNFWLPVKFLSNRARESRFFKYNIPKLREFVPKVKAQHPLESLHIEYSHRVPTSVFVEIYLWELTTESEYDFFSVETSRFSSMPKLENFLYYKAKIMIEMAWPCWHK